MAPDVVLETVILTGLEELIPLETLINTQLSLIQLVDDGAVNPTLEVTVLSTVPKFDPSNVTEYEPTTDPEDGMAEETAGAAYENNCVRVLELDDSEIVTSLLLPTPVGDRTRNEESDTHLAFAIADVEPIPGTAEESMNPKYRPNKVTLMLPVVGDRRGCRPEI